VQFAKALLALCPSSLERACPLRRARLSAPRFRSVAVPRWRAWHVNTPWHGPLARRFEHEPPLPRVTCHGFGTRWHDGPFLPPAPERGHTFVLVGCSSRDEPLGDRPLPLDLLLGCAFGREAFTFRAFRATADRKAVGVRPGLFALFALFALRREKKTLLAITRRDLLALRVRSEALQPSPA
jgi:hypothetical protein